MVLSASPEPGLFQFTGLTLPVSGVRPYVVHLRDGWDQGPSFQDWCRQVKALQTSFREMDGGIGSGFSMDFPGSKDGRKHDKGKMKTNNGPMIHDI